MSSSNNTEVIGIIAEGNTLKDQYLTFVIEDEEYGIEIANIKEIISVTPITLVPETPKYLEGIISLRGDIIPVIDVRKRFLKQSKEYDELTCIVVIEYSEYSVGLVVDAVKEVMYISEENILPPPSDRLNYYNQFIKNIGRVGNDMKLLLDLDKFLVQE